MGILHSPDIPHIFDRNRRHISTLTLSILRSLFIFIDFVRIIKYAICSRIPYHSFLLEVISNTNSLLRKSGYSWDSVFSIFTFLNTISTDRLQLTELQTIVGTGTKYYPGHTYLLILWEGRIWKIVEFSEKRQEKPHSYNGSFAHRRICEDNSCEWN